MAAGSGRPHNLTAARDFMRNSLLHRSFSRAQAKRSRTRRLLMESLERRELLAPLALASSGDSIRALAAAAATSGSIVLNGQTLLVTGTAGHDDISIQSKKNGLFVSLNGK